MKILFPSISILTYVWDNNTVKLGKYIQCNEYNLKKKSNKTHPKSYTHYMCFY